MKRSFLGITAAAAFGLLLVSGLEADAKTKFVYYKVSGSNARDLVSDIIRRGPHLRGRKALATTSPLTKSMNKQHDVYMKLYGTTGQKAVSAKEE